MGGMWRYFLDVLGWGPIQKPGPLQALTHGTARSMDQTREDMLYLRDQWFPARCEESMVAEHGESRGIIRHVGRHATETPEQYRARVVHAYAWHMLGGKVQGLPQILRFYGFDVEAIENMRQFSPTRWAEFMVRLRTPDTYADQEAQLTSLKTLIWLVNEYKPARSYFFRLYNDSYDRRPITLGVGPKLGSGWLSFWSGVVVPETGDDGTLVSFGMKYGFQGETLLRQDMQCGLLSLHSSQGMRRRNAFVLGHSRLSDTFIRRHGFIFSELVSIQNAERYYTPHTWEGPWEGLWEKVTAWTRLVPPLHCRVLTFARSQLVLGRRGGGLSGLNSRLGGVRKAVVVDDSPKLGGFRLSSHGPVRREVPLLDYRREWLTLSAPAIAPQSAQCGLVYVLEAVAERLDENGWTGPWSGPWTAYPMQAGLASAHCVQGEAVAPADALTGQSSLLAVQSPALAPADTGISRTEVLTMHGRPLRDLRWAGAWDARRWWDYTGLSNISTVEE